jgi:N-acetyl sugar amidotransferase
MNSSMPEVVLTASGCNFCSEFENLKASLIDKKNYQKNFVEKIKINGQSKKYDCVIGLSGGVDSSYTLHLAVKLGLRPIVVHLDNGWNSSESQKNIYNLTKLLDVDLYTHVINWDENRSLQRSLFQAHVIDIDMIMDNAQAALNFQIAQKYKIKYILSGTNTSTEGMRLPSNWTNYKFDLRNIRNINAQFENCKIVTHPFINTIQYHYYSSILKIKWINFLDYFDYNKEQAVRKLQHQYQYSPYHYKHGESVFTRFYQNYILPEKFGVDKRIVHYSNLILSGQMTKKNAKHELRRNTYLDSEQFKEDLEYIKVKLGFTSEFLSEYIQAPAIAHCDYGSEKWQKNLINKLYLIFKTIR